MDDQVTQPTFHLASSHHSSRLPIYIGIALFVLTALCALGWFIWTKYGEDLNRGLSLFSKGQVLISPLQPPLFAAAAINFDATTVSEVSTQGQGTASVVGYAKGTENSYYLLTEGDGSQTNIFMDDPKNPGRGLTQKTFSNTLKLGLTYDDQSGALAFAAVPPVASTTGITSGTITILKQGTTTEETFGAGTDPVLLSGGFFIVYEHFGQLFSVNTQTGKVYTLLTVPAEGTFAVDREKMRVAAYDPKQNEIQYFDISQQISASFTDSKKAKTGDGVRRLAFVNGNLVELFEKEGKVNADADAKDGISIPGTLQLAKARIIEL